MPLRFSQNVGSYQGEKHRGCLSDRHLPALRQNQLGVFRGRRRVHLYQLGTMSVVKCKFCDWQITEWWTGKDGRHHNGNNALVWHVKENHRDEWLAIEEEIVEQGPLEALTECEASNR